MKKMVSVSIQVMGTYENLTRDRMIAMMDSALENIPKESRATATLEIQEYSNSYDPYDPDSHYALFINFNRQETNKEEKDREKQETESYELKQARRYYKRLKKKVG